MSTKKLLFYLLAVLLGGCLPVLSLHPLFNEKDVVFDEKLLGTWVDDPNSPETTWEFKKLSQNWQSERFDVPKWKIPRHARKYISDEIKNITGEINIIGGGGEIKIVSMCPDVNAYRLIFSDNEGQKGSFVAHLVKLKDKLFLDIYADKPPYEPPDPNIAQWPYNNIFVFATHTFIKVDAIEPRFILRLTNDDKFKELLEQDPNAVIQHTSLEGNLILTAPTKELQAFVLKYADSDKVFAKDVTLSRKKAAEPNAPASPKPGKSPK